MIAKIPGLWSFVTDENFEKFRALAGIEDGTVLADKINEFRYEVRPLSAIYGPGKQKLSATRKSRNSTSGKHFRKDIHCIM